MLICVITEDATFKEYPGAKNISYNSFSLQCLHDTISFNRNLYSSIIIPRNSTKYIFIDKKLNLII